MADHEQPEQKAPDSNAQWQFHDEPKRSEVKHPSAQPVSWTASEFIAHQKSAGWFLALAGITTVSSVLIYLFTHDIISTAIVPIVAAAFGIFAARQPRVLHYSLDDQGVHIENKSYPFETFKSFAVLEEGPLQSVSLLPMKRFMPAISIYYPEEDEKKILTMLSNFLPLEERPRDPIDRFMHKIRF